MYKSHGAKGRGIESRSFLFIFVNVPRANSSEEMRVDKGTGDPIPCEKKGGSGDEEERPAGVSGMATRKAFGSFQKDD